MVLEIYRNGDDIIFIEVDYVAMRRYDFDYKLIGDTKIETRTLQGIEVRINGRKFQ